MSHSPRNWENTPLHSHVDPWRTEILHTYLQMSLQNPILLFFCLFVSVSLSFFFLTLCSCSAPICISLKHPWHQPERGVGEKGVGLGCGWIMHFILCQFILMIVQLWGVSRWFISIQCLLFCNSFCRHFKHLGCAFGKKDWTVRRLEIFLIYWVGVSFGHSIFFSEMGITRQKVF